MNCKPGDLAIVVKSWNKNDGRIVRCVRLVMKQYKELGLQPSWDTEPQLQNKEGEFQPTADVQLRPIRPGDISDEEVRDLYAPKLPEVA